MMLSALSSPMERNALLMYLALATPGNHILIAYARNGVGKTSLIKQVALSLGVSDDHFKRMSLSRTQPEDFGWPVPSDEGIRLLMPASIRMLNDGAPALLFLDELGDAPRAVQAAAHGLLDDRDMGDDKAKPSLKMLGAMNPPEYSTDAQEMGFGFANRCSFFPFETPSKEDFVSYRMRHGAPQSFKLPPIDSEKRQDAVQYVNAVSAAYFLNNPQAVLEEDPKDEHVASRWPMAFATPRSWDYALNLAATCIAAGDRSAMLVLMTGTIGEPQALSFCAFERDQDLVPGLDALRTPTLFTPDTKRLDRTWAQAMVCVEAACDSRLKDKEQVELWNLGWGFLTHLRDFGGTRWSVVPKDVCLIAAQHLVERMPKRGALLAKHEGIINELAPMVSFVAGLGQN